MKRTRREEIRFLFIRAIGNTTYFDGYYSVEAPTMKKYRFKDAEPKVTKDKIKAGFTSASVDVCLYNSKLERTKLIEFKAHNAPLNHIKKDILKLIKEEGLNYFIHVFKNIDSKTLPRVLTKFKKSIKAVWSTDECENYCKSITFYICVSSKSLILKRAILLHPDSKAEDLSYELGENVLQDWEKV